MREYVAILFLIVYTVFFFNVGRTISVALLCLIGEPRPFRRLVGEDGMHHTFTNPYDIGTEDTFTDQARELVRDYLNHKWEQETENLRTAEPGKEFVAAQIELKDVYVVWFAKTLQNWKALVSTTVLDGRYYEVTHNGVKRETYLDVYVKESNNVIPDPR